MGPLLGLQVVVFLKQAQVESSNKPRLLGGAGDFVSSYKDGPRWVRSHFRPSLQDLAPRLLATYELPCPSKSGLSAAPDSQGA